LRLRRAVCITSVSISRVALTAFPPAFHLSLLDALPICSRLHATLLPPHARCEGWIAHPEGTHPARRDRGPPWRGEFLQGERSSLDRKSARLNSSHEWNSYAVFCLKKRR